MFLKVLAVSYLAGMAVCLNCLLVQVKHFIQEDWQNIRSFRTKSLWLTDSSIFFIAVGAEVKMTVWSRDWADVARFVLGIGPMAIAAIWFLARTSVTNWAHFPSLFRERDRI